MDKVKKFIKDQPVLIIAFLAALATIFVIPPDSGYKDYVNFTVLIQLFCLMTAIGGFRSIGLFEKLTAVLMKKAGNVRRLGLIFTILCFFSSMLVTNDVALITFVPLTLMVFDKIKDEKSRILTIVLETAAANLGSMATPVGNPQNLFLYSAFNLSADDFFSVTLPLTAVSFLCLLFASLPVLPASFQKGELKKETINDKVRLTLYSALFLLSLLPRPAFRREHTACLQVRQRLLPVQDRESVLPEETRCRNERPQMPRRSS